MKVKLQVLKDSKVVEEYMVPDGSWVQTDSLGAQHVPAVTQPTLIEGYKQGLRVRFEPINPPVIPSKVAELLGSRDPRWGKNGFEWQGNHRDRSGGTVLDRAREMCWGLSWRRDFPLKEDPAVMKFCETGLG